MIICGLTGGVGMGKSTAAGFFLELGACVVDTDQLARQLVQLGQPALVEIQNKFGENIVSSSGELRRDELARTIFAYAEARKKLEDILHPLIRESWLAQIEIWRKENRRLAIVVIPLLFETQAETYFDTLICAACSSVEQHERLQARGWNDEQIRQRIMAQLPAETKMTRSDYVLWTEGSLASHQQQAAQIFQKIS